MTPTSPKNSGTSDDDPPVELTDDGQLVGKACPSLWQQCAGKNYDGKQNCCQQGLECIFSNPWYSQCQPKAGDMPCSSTDDPEGEPEQEPAPEPVPQDLVVPEEPQEQPEPEPTQPVPGPKPQAQPPTDTDDTSSCPKAWKQCAGDGYRGIQNCCSEGNVCTFQSKWYSQCRPGNVACNFVP